jgi:NTP pyrophosphatase (non-canonical NTP hydrolase)
MIMQLNDLAHNCYENAHRKGFWAVADNVAPDGRYNINVMLCKLALIHSEVSEALEEIREKGKLTENVTEEMADIIIRVCDFCGGYDLDIAGAVATKMAKNKTRPSMHGKHA